MNILALPWLELAIALPLVGALCLCLLRVPQTAARWCLVFTGLAFLCASLEWLAHSSGAVTEPGARWQWLSARMGGDILAVDELSAPLLPLVALLHFLTVLTTGRTKMARFSFAGMLVSEALRLATFGCKVPWVLIGLLTAATVPAYLELLARRKPTRVYILHMGLFAILLVLGWFIIEARQPGLAAWGAVLLLGAILVRCGTVPAHCWVTDLFEHASFGTALLSVTPIAGVYAALRLAVPVAPDWVLQGIGLASLITAVYAAGMAVVQREVRRFFAFLFISHASLILVGLELLTPISLTGALALWFSVILSLGGLGLTLRALEARCGRLSLASYHGLYEHSPALAVSFLLTALASVGFPGTLGFISAELLVDGAVEANPSIGLAVILTTALNGIAVVRAYFLLFTGTRRASSVSMAITPREQFAVLTLAALILGGGFFPQPGIASRYAAATALLRAREPRASRPPVQPEVSATDDHGRRAGTSS